MEQWTALTLLCIFAALCFRTLSAWRQNHRIAKSTGFPTLYSPVHIQDLWWLALQEILGPYLELLPRSWTQPWLSFGRLWRLWHVGYKPFAEVGSDTVLLASPSGNALWTCDDKVAKQLYSSPTVQVPVDAMKWLDIWGPTISTVEGQEWKAHRRAITHGFNLSTHAMAWGEAIYQTNGLIDCWRRDDDEIAVSNVQHWTSRLTLHILVGVLFNRRLDWRPEKRETLSADDVNGRMSFATALLTVVSRIGFIFATPRVLLRLPINHFRNLRRAMTDLTYYMEDMRSETIEKSEEVTARSKKSLLESIVLAGMTGAEGVGEGGSALAADSILGNIFVTLMAGHETTGNTLAFTLLLLAVYPEYQEEIQADLDRVLGNRAQHEWNIEHDYAQLQSGILGAVIREVLRQYCVIEFGLRTTIAPTPVIDTSGKQHMIPAGTTCVMDFSAACQNPAIWQPAKMSDERRKELHYSHAIDFNPRRWLNGVTDAPTDSFWPFATGFRKCPGRQFAQIGIVGVLATLLKRYTIELVIDEECLRIHRGDEEAAWKSVRDEAIRKLEYGVEAYLSVYIKTELPIKVRSRGS